MELSKISILSKTHYGINIYAFILRQYYPGQFLISISGRKCKPVKNPFNNGRSKLLIEIKNNCAVHTDSKNSIPSGDVFNFAALHFKLSEQELLYKLNKVMCLRIGQKKGFYDQEDEIYTQPEPNFIKPIPPVFSFYKKPITNVVPAKEISLLEVYKLILGSEFASCTNRLHNIKDKKEARKYKARNFDYVTISGKFSKRNDKHLKKHSGLLTIDFDHISNNSILKEELLKDEYFETELLFTSPSGDGLKWIIPIELAKFKHQDYFKAVANYIQHTYNLKVDGSGKDISRACFLPHDPNVFINPKYL